MKFTVDKKKELTIFKLMESRLDATIAPDLKSEFVILIEAEGKKYIIVDISQVEAIDSSGIGALLMAHRQTADREGFAAFAGVKNRVRDLLKMTGLEKQLFIFSSVQEALNSIETVDSDDTETEKPTKKRSSQRKSKKKKASEVDFEEDELIGDIPEIASADLEIDDINEEMSFNDDFETMPEEDENAAKASDQKKSDKKNSSSKSTRKKSK